MCSLQRIRWCVTYKYNIVDEEGQPNMSLDRQVRSFEKDREFILSQFIGYSYFTYINHNFILVWISLCQLSCEYGSSILVCHIVIFNVGMNGIPVKWDYSSPNPWGSCQRYIFNGLRINMKFLHNIKVKNIVGSFQNTLTSSVNILHHI